MKNSLQEQIRRCFPYLFEKLGFKFVKLKNDFSGNIAVAQSDKLRIRFIQDRADFFLDIGDIRKPEQWINFYKILDQLRASGRVRSGYKYLNKMKAVSILFAQHFSEISDWVSQYKPLSKRTGPLKIS